MHPAIPHLCLALALLAACSADPGPAGRPREHPPLARLRALESPPTMRRVARLSVREDYESWTIEGTASLSRRGENEPRLRFKGRGPWRVRIPGPFDPRTFNRVALRGRFGRGTVVELSFVREGAEPYVHPDRPTVVIGNKLAVNFDLLETGGNAAPFARDAPFTYEALELGFERAKTPFELNAVELFDQPFELRMPLPESGGDLIHVADASRLGTGLAAGTPLWCEFEVESDRDVLTFGCALEPQLRADGREPRVQVTLEAGDTSSSHAVSLENDAETPSRWHDARIALERKVSVASDLSEHGDRR